MKQIKLRLDLANFIGTFENDKSDDKVEIIKLNDVKKISDIPTLTFNYEEDIINEIETPLDSTDDDITDAEINAKLAEVDNITSIEKSRLKDLIVKHRDIFRKSPGRFNSYVYKLEFNDTNPYFCKSYPVPMKLIDKVDREIERMLRFGIIERSKSQFINPLVSVIKKDGSVRLCLDARELNKRLQNDHDGPEGIDEVLRKCNGVRIMSSVDLTSSFWQIPLERESRKYTAFLHRGMTYHHCVMPFGTKVSSAALNRASESILKGLSDFIINFVDDWLCISSNFNDHLEHLEVLFERIALEGATVNFKKVEFCRKEMRFLGHILTTEGIKIDPEKVAGIRKFPPPRNVKQLKGFLGLINFCSKFTNELAHETVPLFELTKKGVTWEWSDKQVIAFERVKNLFVTEALLYYPSRDRPFYLMTDASKTSLGAFIYQKDDTGSNRIVSMANRTLRGAEINYFTTELELLAIVWALNKFRSYVIGGEVLIETDHKALEYLLNCRFLNNRLIRWRLAIQDYDVRITHIPGTRNQIADALSRIPVDRNDGDNDDITIDYLLYRRPNKDLINRLKDIKGTQRKDSKLLTIISRLEKGDPYRNFRLKNEILLKVIGKDEKIVMSEELFEILLKETHELYGHVGTYKCYRLIEEDFWCTKLRKKIARIIKSCDSCQRNKTFTQGLATITQPIIPKGSGDLLSIDFLGPLPVSKGGTRYILVALDAFTKFVRLYPIRKADTRTTINKIFGDYIPKYGAPRRIQSDHGTQFTGKAWREKLVQEGVKISFSSIRHPQSNIVERVNKEIGRFFRTLTSHSHGGWAHWVPFVETCINEMHHETTEFTPIELQAGIKPQRYWKKWLIPLEKNDIPLETKLIWARDRIIKKGKKAAGKGGTKKGKCFEVGDLVLVKNLALSNALDNVVAKFVALYDGPYVIKEKCGPCTYKIIDDKTNRERGIFHAINLRPYFKDGPKTYPKEAEESPAGTNGENRAGDHQDSVRIISDSNAEAPPRGN